VAQAVSPALPILDDLYRVIAAVCVVDGETRICSMPSTSTARRKRNTIMDRPMPGNLAFVAQFRVALAIESGSADKFAIARP